MKVKIIRGKNIEDLKEVDFYRKEVEVLIDSGYIDYKGQPVKCRYCGSKKLKECNKEIGGYNIPEGCLCEYDVCCEECGEVVAHWAYGGWDY